MAWLHGHKRVPIQVMAGDMNETPDGLAVNHIKQSFRSAYESVYGREPLATFPTALIAGAARHRPLPRLYLRLSGSNQDQKG